LVGGRKGEGVKLTVRVSTDPPYVTRGAVVVVGVFCRKVFKVCRPLVKGGIKK